MIRLSVRSFSTSLTHFKRILPSVNVSDAQKHTKKNEGFEKNFPIIKRAKAWEITGEDKETYFKRKHAHTHARDKKRGSSSKRMNETDKRTQRGRRDNDRSFKLPSRNDDRAFGKRDSRARDSRSAYSEDRSREPRRDRRGDFEKDDRRGPKSNRGNLKTGRTRLFDKTFESFDNMDGVHDKREVYSGIRPSPLSEYIYGTNPVLAALLAERREYFSRLLVYNSKPEDQEILTLAESMNIPIKKAKDKNELNILSNNGVHNGFVLETKPFVPQPIFNLADVYPSKGAYDLVDDVLGDRITRRCTTSNPNPFGVYLDEVTDPHNIGAIIRSAYFLGADFVVTSSKNCAPLSPVVSKTSVGALEFLPVYTCSSPLSFLEKSKENGWLIVSAGRAEHPSDAKIDHTLKQKAFKFRGLNTLLQKSPTLLVLGSEGQGIRTTMKLKSDHIVEISARSNINPVVDSLNVSVAAALFISKIMEVN